VLAIASQIETEQSEHPTARRLADEALFGLGQRFFANAQYWHALEHFNGVSEDFEGLRQAIAATKEQIRTQALHEKLELARQHLQNSEYRRAITVAQAILDEDSANQTALELLQRARYFLGQQLMSEGRDLEAIATLSNLDPAYKDTAVLINDARIRLNSLAETHYRIGVKYYINEELALAIKEWQTTLRLCPDHPKARRDIDNARRLLQRLEAYDKRPVQAGQTP
jgi:tetratricopeptide (TPR) repeat protein